MSQFHQDHISISIPKNEEEIQQLETKLKSYECHICYDVSTEPVITPCGHLFCWACIYSWLNSNSEFLTCPVCKNGIDIKDLIPIYTKQQENAILQKNIQNQQQQQQQKNEQGIPPRPLPRRTRPIRNRNAIGQHGNFINMNSGMNLQQGVLLAGYGLFPSLFNLLFTIGNKIDDSGQEHQSPEIQHKNLFNKIILILLLICILLIIFI